MQPSWRELSQAQREAEYSPSSVIGGDIQPYLDAYADLSEMDRVACADAGADPITLKYGTLDSQTIDLVVPPDAADRPAPLLVYIHGGYWQLLSKRESFFAAADCLSQSIAFAAVDYTLAPDASLDEIVAECRSALALIVMSADELGIDAERIFVAGSSAGAHLAAMVALDQTATPRLAGVILVSGIYDLEPLIGTSINDAVGMDVVVARRNSPFRQDLNGFPRALIAFGEIETGEFKSQSRLFSERAAKAGVETQVLEIADKNHFDVILDLANPAKPLGQAVAGLIQH